MNTALRIHSTHAAASPPKTAECYVFSGSHGAWSVLYAAASPTERDRRRRGDHRDHSLAPRLERHIASGDVCSAAVVLEFVHQSVSILDAFGDPDLPLLKCCDSRENELVLRQTPVAIRPTRTLQGRVRARDADAPEVHPRHSFRGCAAPLELRIQQVAYPATYTAAIYRGRHLT